ncbi:siphovirus ReqiPepy6 Gp37-like family protein [Bacillus sp. UNC322MFChir4.1]|uniref:siphovirus ReqiPepy6 Gp37-like family protein n=1 Tax=Bacillus sp. UNC322MFChir4.1 TaxID=1449045 RepID=UPI0005553EB6|nr:siphovirus ReqiPepy6 Gp37-like family protein [Bacillus sp. UNC322MFChir4.1]
MKYKIYVRDEYLNRVAEIDDFQKLDIIPRFNAVGSWALDIPTDSRAAKELIKPRAGIIVVRNGKTILSGSTDNRSRKWNQDTDMLTFSGSDDNVYLQNLAYPHPGGNFSLQDHDVRTGVAETIMKQYVDVNIGPSALSQRRMLALEVNRGLGKIVTGRARFNMLIDLLASLAISGGDLGFRVVQVNKTLQFQVYQPTDKTRSVFFSPLLGNLRDFEYNVKAPETNYVICGGGGEGVNRILLERGDSVSISQYGRKESFIDQRNTTDTNEIQQSMDQSLIEKGEKTSLKITPIDTPSLTFNKDYYLGDKVSVVITQPGEMANINTVQSFISSYQNEYIRKTQEKLDVIQDIMREIKITITPNGESISPVIGTPDSISNSSRGIFDKMKKIMKRVSNLERR